MAIEREVYYHVACDVPGCHEELTLPVGAPIGGDVEGDVSNLRTARMAMRRRGWTEAESHGPVKCPDCRSGRMLVEGMERDADSHSRLLPSRPAKL